MTKINWNITEQELKQELVSSDNRWHISKTWWFWKVGGTACFESRKSLPLAGTHWLRNIQQRHRTSKGGREGHRLCSSNSQIDIACPGNHSCHFAWDFAKEHFNGNIAEKLAWKLGRAKKIFWDWVKRQRLQAAGIILPPFSFLFPTAGLFAYCFFDPEEIHDWQNENGSDAENSHFKGFYERTRGNTA